MKRDVCELCRLWAIVDDATKDALLKALRHSAPERDWRTVCYKHYTIIGQ